MTLSNSLGVGDSLAVVGVTNIALVAFDIYNSEIRVCSYVFINTYKCPQELTFLKYLVQTLHCHGPPIVYKQL